jgi:Pyruvate/2-oxoacid:ferredoxin oxidoreductase delta subunit
MARVTTDLNEELRDDPTAWMNYSACIGADITEFYPPEDASTEDQDKIVSEVTDKYCSKCPVRTLCYDFAKETNSVGIWGCTFFPYDGTLPSDPEEENNVR